MSVWRRSTFYLEGKAHGFRTDTTTESACGREQYPGNIWTEPLTEEPTDKCKTCVYVLEGSNILARQKLSGGGIVHG